MKEPLPHKLLMTLTPKRCNISFIHNNIKNNKEWKEKANVTKRIGTQVMDNALVFMISYNLLFIVNSKILQKIHYIKNF